MSSVLLRDSVVRCRRAASILAVLLALASYSVAGFAADPLGVVEQAVSGGTPHEGDPAVVAIVTAEGGLCTGTLISPYVVLTASHCLLSMNTYVFFGNDIYGEGEFVPVLEYHAHPDWDSSVPVIDYEADIALLTLAERAPTRVTPQAVQTEPLTDDLQGATVRLVGYGRDPEEPRVLGLKKLGFASFVDFDHDAILYLTDPNMNCPGDSGGPLFVEVDGE